MKKVIYITVISIFTPIYFLYAEDGFTQRDRELLIELKVKMQEINKRFGDMFDFLWILTGIFTTLKASVIGFAYWDRRTMTY